MPSQNNRSKVPGTASSLPLPPGKTQIYRPILRPQPKLHDYLAPDRRQIQVISQIFGSGVMRLNRIPAPKHRMINFDLPDVDHAKVNIKEAEVLLQAGVLVMPVAKNDQGDGWIVTLAGKHKLNSKLEIMRVFKRMDAAVGVLFDTGFERVTIVRS